MDLVQWLNAQLDTDERLARAASAAPWLASGVGDFGWAVHFSRANGGLETEDSEQGRADTVFIAEHDPARVLREIDAKRQNLAELKAAEEAMDQASRDRDTVRYNEVRAGWTVLRRVVQRDTAVYADRPGYLAEWAPSK